MQRLLKLTKILRDPQKGCPWDQKQTFNSFKKCLAEEVEEIFQAIDTEDYENLCEELGDTLFNLVFLINLAEEQQLFDMEAVISGVYNKMIARHPHVFGDKKANSPEEALRLFNQAKEELKNKNKK